MQGYQRPHQPPLFELENSDPPASNLASICLKFVPLHCVSYLLLRNEFSQSLVVSNNSICYLPVAVGQESRHTSPESLAQGFSPSYHQDVAWAVV